MARACLYLQPLGAEASYNKTKRDLATAALQPAAQTKPVFNRY